MSPNYVLRISFEMIRKKLRSPLWRWDRYSYEEGLMAPLDAKGSFIPGYSFSSIHSIKTVTNLHPSFGLNVFHRTLHTGLPIFLRLRLKLIDPPTALLVY